MQKRGQLDEAIDLLEKALPEYANEPFGDAEVRFALAQIYWHRSTTNGGQANSDREEAISRAREAVTRLEQADSEDEPALFSDIHLALGTYLTETNDFAGAIDVYRALSGRGDISDLARARAQHRLGQALLERGASGDLAAAATAENAALATARKAKDRPPELEGSIHYTLGLVFQEQSKPAEAVEHLSKAVDLLRDDPDPRAYPDALLNLVLALTDTGQYAEARNALGKLNSAARGHKDAWTLNALGLAALRLGDLSEASTQLYLARNEAKTDPEFKNDASFQVELALAVAECASEMGDFHEAENILTDAARMANSPGVHPKNAALVQADLGRLYLTLERFDQAQTQLNTALSALQGTWGADNAQVYRVKLDLANLSRIRGYEVESKNGFNEAIRGLTSALGEDHPNTAMAMMELAELLRDSGQCAQALSTSKQAMDALDSRMGADHKQAVVACLKAAIIAGDCQEAPGGASQFRSLASEAEKRFEHLREELGADNVQIMNALVMFADLSSKTPSAYKNALERYRQAEKQQVDLYGESALSVAELRLKRGKLLENLNQPRDAADVYNRAIKAMGSDLQQSFVRAQLFLALGDVFYTLDDKPRAGSMWSQGLQIAGDIYGPNHPKVQQLKAERMK